MSTMNLRRMHHASIDLLICNDIQHDWGVESVTWLIPIWQNPPRQLREIGVARFAAYAIQLDRDQADTGLRRSDLSCV